MNKTSLVSVIITTRNEEKNINACLSSLLDQTYKNIEIIVIDNHSTDKTIIIAKKYTHYIYSKGPERSVQRNFGVLKAKGEYLLFLDADMILTPTVVEDCVQKIQDPRLKNEKLVALVIPEQSVGIGFWAQCKALERSFYIGVPWMEAARFYRRDAFATLQGFDEHLTGPEDFDLSARAEDVFGTESIGRITSCIKHNENKIHLFSLLQKKFYYGKQMKRYEKKQGKKGYFDKQANILFRYGLFFAHPKKLFHNFVVGVGMIALKTMEMIALAMGALMNF